MPSEIGGATFNRARKFGVELECYAIPPETVAAAIRAVGVECQVEAYNHARRTGWKIVSDASIRGVHPFELVSPPMTGDDGLEQVRKVCGVLRACGVKVNKSTGLHVHHDAADMTLDNLKAVVTMWWKYEDVIQFFLPPSRRNNFYCAPCMPRAGSCGYRWSPTPDPVSGWRTAMNGIRRREDFQRFENGRYGAVNFDSLWRHGTIEFRAHSGTIDAAKVCAWIALTQWFLERGKLKGCRTAARMVGRWAEHTMYFWRAIDWVNLTDPVIVDAKNTLTRRFFMFKELAPTAEGVNRMGADGRPVQGRDAGQPEVGEER